MFKAKMWVRKPMSGLVLILGSIPDAWVLHFDTGSSLMADD